MPVCHERALLPSLASATTASWFRTSIIDWMYCVVVCDLTALLGETRLSMFHSGSEAGPLQYQCASPQHRTTQYINYTEYGVRHNMIWVNAPCNRRVAALPYLWSIQYIWPTRTLFLDLSLLQKTRLRCKKTAGGRVRCKWSVGGTYELVPTSRLCSGEVTTRPKP